ncbi:hypothetical protein QCA50_006452 [Cerrena zonata]|uniref:Uncharacterized protein n=1 Tax=Cerrena zonata TaxID=2478898 RepID=A0AAW0G857_9APHY
MLCTVQKVYCYVPSKEWLISFAKEEGRISKDPVGYKERIFAMNEALIDVIDDAELGGIADYQLVRIKDMPMYAIILANNWDNKRALEEQIGRVKTILGTKASPKWRVLYSQ